MLKIFFAIFPLEGLGYRIFTDICLNYSTNKPCVFCLIPVLAIFNFFWSTMKLSNPRYIASGGGGGGGGLHNYPDFAKQGHQLGGLLLQFCMPP